jgi:hypothetical protein
MLPAVKTPGWALDVAAATPIQYTSTHTSAGYEIAETFYQQPFTIFHVTLFMFH